MNLQYRPIKEWPGTLTSSRRRSLFKAGYGSTLKLLDSEALHTLGAKVAVLEVAVSESDLRVDGSIRRGGLRRHPGIILSFDSRHGPLSYPCDRFDHWQDNLRAIALSLEHLRAIDRYGVTSRGEQYKGWARLPAPVASMTAEAASRFLSEMTGGTNGAAEVILASPDALAIAYKAAAFRTHPDRGGNPGDFQRVQEARRIIELAQNGATS